MADLGQQFWAFASTVTIPSRDQGLVRFRPWGTQRYLIAELLRALALDRREVVVLKARQIGATTAGLIWDAFWLLKHRGLQGQFSADSDDNRDFFRDLLSEMLKTLPAKYTYPIRANNRTQLAWANGSRLLFQAVGSTLKKAGKTGRGRGLNYHHATEMGEWQVPEAVASLRAAFSERHPAALYIWEGTAKGYNHFYDMWQDANRAVTIHPIFLAWWRHEGYRVEPDSKIFRVYWDGRLTAEEGAWAEELHRRWEVVLGPEQWAWRRWKLAEKMGGDELLMHQEFPCCIGTTRVSTEQGLIPLADAEHVKTTESGRVLRWYAYPETDVFRLRTEAGRELVATGDHPIQRPDGTFVPLRDAMGEPVRCCPPRFADTPVGVQWSDLRGLTTHFVVDEDWGRLLGYLMGNGSFTLGTVSVACDGQDQDVVADVVALLGRCLRREPAVRKVSRGGVEVRVGSAAFRALAIRLGIWRLDTKPHRRVCVPEEIFRSPAPVVREFLRGLFEADGFVDRAAVRVSLFSKHVAFLRDVQLLLLGFGIPSRVRSRMATSRLIGDYVAHTLDLRAAETRVFLDRIGFISARKTRRVQRPPAAGGARRRPLDFTDRVASVEPAGRAPVYDFTVEGHVFGANGLATHNTLPEHAFQSSGRPFIGHAALGWLRAQLATVPQPTWYRYTFGGLIEHTEVAATEARMAHLTVWEEPRPGAHYLVAADPAYGASAASDRYVCGVWRAGRTHLTQVASFVATEVTMQQFAWVTCHLAGAYTPSYFILELNGPGMAVWQELERLRSWGWGTARRAELQDAMGGIQNYLYRRADSVGTSMAWQWKTTPATKFWMLTRLRDQLLQRALTVRDPRLVEELQNVRQEGDRFKTDGHAHDDHVIAAALAVEMWSAQVLPLLEQLPPEPTEAGPVEAPPAHERVMRQFFQQIGVGPAA